MNKRLKLKLIMALYFFLSWPCYAQEEAQSLCVQETVSRCLLQCEKSHEISCTPACQENAKNQCRQAGE